MAKKAAKKPGKTVGSGLSAAEIARLCEMSLARVYAELAQGRSTFEIIATAQRRKQQAATRATVLPADVDVIAPSANGSGPPPYSISLARKEHLQADLKQVDLEQRRGNLVPVAYVRLMASRLLVGAKDILLAGPSELADRLAAESNPYEVEAMVQRWVERALAKFVELDAWDPPPPPAPPGMAA
jgi:hypothetical protein